MLSQDSLAKTDLTLFVQFAGNALDIPAFTIEDGCHALTARLTHIVFTFLSTCLKEHIYFKAKWT
jgi:hypothetical protein